MERLNVNAQIPIKSLKIFNEKQVVFLFKNVSKILSL